MEYIDKAKLMAKIESEYREWGEDYDAYQILGDIEDFPVEDVAPVVPGKWISGRCSVCGEFIPTDNARDCITEDEVHYCLSCGAKME